MKYPEYLSSAKRHSHACKLLKEKIATYGNENSNIQEFKYLVLSLYYLSGYIIECSLKFKILELSGFGSELEVTNNECNKFNIRYRQEIKIHDFAKLQDVLDSKSSDISHESDDDRIEYLLLGWDPKIRYEDVSLDHQDVDAFYEHAVCFLRKM